jgi:hypothetical protein
MHETVQEYVQEVKGIPIDALSEEVLKFITEKFIQNFEENVKESPLFNEDLSLRKRTELV